MRTLRIAIDDPERIREERVEDEAHAARLIAYAEQVEGWTVHWHEIEEDEA